MKILKNILHKDSTKTFLLLLCFAMISVGVHFYKQNIIATSSTVGKRELPIYCVDTDKKQVALSFDAAWGDEDTIQILDILDKYNVKVTFFMTGGWVEAYPDKVKEIAARGHDLGNHSENHKQMSKLSVADQTSEIMKVHEEVKALTGIEMTLFRPPFGDYNNSLITTYKLSEYTDALASQNAIKRDADGGDFSLEFCKNLCRQVLGPLYKD